MSQGFDGTETPSLCNCEFYVEGDLQQEIDNLKQSALSAVSESKNFEEVFPEPRLSVFVAYLFVRRFGWSEFGTQEELDSLPISDTLDLDGESKKQLNDILDDLIAALQRQPITIPLLNSFSLCLRESNKKPVVREQTFKVLFDWFRVQLSFCEEGNLGESADMIQRLIIQGLTDVWSVIRKGCASRLNAFVDCFDMAFVESLYNALVQICLSQEASWQSQEGAVLGITMVVRKFQWEPQSAGPTPSQQTPSNWQTIVDAAAKLPVEQEAPSSNPASETHLFITTITPPPPPPAPAPNLQRKSVTIDVEAINAHLNSSSSSLPNSSSSKHQPAESFNLKFGTRIFARLPEYITSTIRGVLFSLLGHEQLSVRENATRAFRAFLSRSEFLETTSSFTDVIARLSGGTGTAQPPPTDAPIRLLDAHLAEGLLSLCVILLKTMPSSSLTSTWDVYSPTLLAYLAHPASTVRQIASTAFQHLIAKDNEKLKLTKRILSSLTKQSANVLPSPASSTHAIPTSSSDQPPAATNATTRASWELREGLMMSYELVLTLLLTQYEQFLFPSVFSSTPSSALSKRGNSPSMMNLIARANKENAGVGLLAVAQECPSPAPWTITTAGQQTLAGGGAQLNTPMSTTSRGSSTIIESPMRRVNISVQSPATPKPPFGRGWSSGGLMSLPEGVLDQLQQTAAAHQVTGESTPHKYGLRAGDEEAAEGTTPSVLDRLMSLDEAPKGSSQGPWFRQRLHAILTKTKECFGSSRWELRRMANQVLPMISSVALVADCELLCELWEESVRPASDARQESTPTAANVTATAFALGTLKHALLKCAQLEDLLATQHGESLTRQRLANQIQTLHTRLAPLLPSLSELCSSPSHRIVASALDCLIIFFSDEYLSSPKFTPSHTRESCLQSVVTKLVSINQKAGGGCVSSTAPTSAFPSSPKKSAAGSAFTSMSPRKSSVLRPTDVSTAGGGGGGGGGGGTSTTNTAAVKMKALQKTVANTASKCWPRFVGACGLPHGLKLVPFLLSSLSLDDELKLSLNFLDSLNKIFCVPFSRKLQRIEKDSIPSEGSNPGTLRSSDLSLTALPIDSDLESACWCCVERLVPILKQRGIEASLVRPILEILRRVIFVSDSPSRYIPHVLSTMVHKFKFEDEPSLVHNSSKVNLFRMLSNDLPLSLEGHEQSGSESDDEETTLTYKTDEESDWDDWDEDEDLEEQDKLLLEFGVFLESLQKDASQQGEGAEAFGGLSPLDQKHVEWILKKHKDLNAQRECEMGL